MRGQELLARLREEVLIGDGALGTMFSERGVGGETGFERLNLTHPDLVQELHQAYVAAGSQILETNTFGANRTKLASSLGVARSQLIAAEVRDVNRAGVALAQAAAKENAYVAGSVGPLADRSGPLDQTPFSDDEIRDVFREQMLALADAGVDLLMLETFTDLRQLLLALEVAKKHTDLPVACQLAFHERGHTHRGVDARTAFEALTRAGASIVGANCGRGVRCVMAAVQSMTGTGETLVSAYPNAGLPTYVDGRYLFGAPLPYLTQCADQMATMGVNLIGGCCGTTPEYIRRISERLRQRKPGVRVQVPAEPSRLSPSDAASVAATPLIFSGTLLERFAAREPAPAAFRPRPLVVVELDPPKNLRYEAVLRRAQQLRDMGVDAITMADNPVATLHMGNMHLAQVVQREADIPVIVHLTCRDHNLLGLQSLLMSAHMMGLHHLLALTGDPARVGNQPGATSVYDLNSFGLVELIRKFNAGVNNAEAPLGEQTRSIIGVAFNPNGRNLAGLIARLAKKVKAGAHFAMTQPIYDPDRFDQMIVALRELPAPLDTDLPRFPVLCGLMPLLSERNAEYLHNEVPGIALTEEARQRMKGLSGPAGRAEGLKICHELIDHMGERADGYYLIPSQIRTEMAVDLVAHLNQRLPQLEERLTPVSPFPRLHT